MFCTRCGNQIPDGNQFCPSCGAPADEQQSQQFSQQPQQYAQPQYTQQPQPPQYTQQPYVQQQTYGQPMKTESAALAVCALIFSFIFPLVGLILGIVGAAKYKVNYKGMCIASIIISSVFIVLSMILSSIIVPSMLSYIERSRKINGNKPSTYIYDTKNVYVAEADLPDYDIISDMIVL